MNIKFKNASNAENSKNQFGLKSAKRESFPHHSTLSYNNLYEERPLKSNSQDLSFKGLSSVKVSDAIKRYSEEIGESAAKHLEETITRVTSAKNSGVSLVNDELVFKNDTFVDKLYRSIADPVIYLPLDITNSSLNFLKRTSLLKNSKFIDNLLERSALKNRSTYLENFSNTMALQHYFEMLSDDKLKGNILKEAQKRFNLGRSNYTVKGERSLTRTVTGVIPAFFLANDAYNLSMYVNDNKDLAKKEKRRRFYQELGRVGVTAAATFATLGFFSKKVSSNPETATVILASLTFASELIGRMMTGTPFYPIGKKDAIKYAKLQNKDKLKRKKNDNAQTNSNIDKMNKSGEASKSDIKKEKSKSNYALKLLGAMVLAGFLIDKRSSVKPVRKLVNSLISQYKEFFAKDYTITRKEFDEIILKLRENGFNKLADNYVKRIEKILKEGNLTAKESLRFDREIEKRSEQYMPGRIILNQDKLNSIQKEAKKKVNREEVLQSLRLAPRSNDIININGDLSKIFKESNNINKHKDIMINSILALPIKFVWEILNMPYKYVVQPLIELPMQGRKMFKAADKEPSDKDMFRNSIDFLRKNIDKSDFKDKINKAIIDSFDNVNKSNLSSAELGGSAKIAVSTATSAFLILDNYNMVMIDTEGKDKKLAGQKAKERTIQRIVRIAYGAVLIKLFNGIFKSQYDASLLGAQTVNTANTLVTEVLERTSVGLPLHEATREETIEKDNETLHAKGLKGIYFRFMSKLTGKKPLSEMKADKK